MAICATAKAFKLCCEQNSYYETEFIDLTLPSEV